MKKFIYLKDPGVIYDLAFVFFWKYNQERFFEIFSITDPEEQAFYESTLPPLAPESDELSLFFCAGEDKRCFFPQGFFHPYQSRFSQDYSLSLVLEELGNYTTVLRRMIRYYCYHLSEDEIAECVSSPAKVFAEIKRSSYSETMKNRLYEFFMDPVPYIELLRKELLQVSEKISAYYQANESKLQALAERLTVEDFLAQHQLLCRKNSDLSEYTPAETMLLSLCLLNKDVIFINIGNEKTAFVLLGVDYEASIRRNMRQPYAIKLEDFGTALGDENRVKMLNLLLEHGELSCKALATHFPFSDSTTYHHLSIMLQCGILRRRLQEKNILYSLNPDYFKSVIDFLQKYSEQ